MLHGMLPAYCRADYASRSFADSCSKHKNRHWRQSSRFRETWSANPHCSSVVKEQEPLPGRACARLVVFSRIRLTEDNADTPARAGTRQAGRIGPWADAMVQYGQSGQGTDAVASVGLRAAYATRSVPRGVSDEYSTSGARVGPSSRHY